MLRSLETERKEPNEVQNELGRDQEVMRKEEEYQSILPFKAKRAKFFPVFKWKGKYIVFLGPDSIKRPKTDIFVDLFQF